MINRKNRTTMKLRKYLAVLAVAAFANVAYDTYIYPSLSGLKDLSDPMEIKVRAGDNGSRTYTLWAFYTRR